MPIRTLAGRSQILRRLMGRQHAAVDIAPLLSPYLPPMTCIDVGASYFPHTRWLLFLESRRTAWIAVDPNEANLAYLNRWPWKSSASKITCGLSRNGGTKTLYVTNVDSGSSLLEPSIPPSMHDRIVDTSYLFPVTTRQVETIALADVVAHVPDVTAPIFVKLDTQGTELDILQGATRMLADNRIPGIELEATLLAQPVMHGAGKFWEAAQFLEGMGFELMFIDPIYAPPRAGSRRGGRHTFLNECDAAFVLRPDIVRELSAEIRTGVLAFQLCYGFYEQALTAMDSDTELRDFLGDQDCPFDQLQRVVTRLATQRHLLGFRSRP